MYADVSACVHMNLQRLTPAHVFVCKTSFEHLGAVQGNRQDGEQAERNAGSQKVREGRLSGGGA